jgi:SHS2 domain-containing protein
MQVYSQPLGESSGPVQVYGLQVGSYSVLDHTADTGIEAEAPSLAELVETLTTGMFELMADMGGCSASGSVELEVVAESNDDLVYEALSELLYRSDVEGLLFCDIDVAVIDDRSLAITAKGISSEDVELVGPPIKAVTYHDIEVTETGEGWHGRVYFDV